MKRFKHLLMMAAMAITLCAGFTACGDDDDDDDTTSGAIKVTGADWSFSRYFYFADKYEYYDELDSYFVMQGQTGSETFRFGWYPGITALRDGTGLTDDIFFIYSGQIEDADERELVSYDLISGTITATEVTNSTCTVKFQNLKLRMYYNTSGATNYPESVTINGTATFQKLH